MSHKEDIKKNGYVIFDLTKDSDKDATTPIETKYTAILLCTQGEAIFEANMENYHLHKGECLCLRNVLYKRTTQMSDDFKAKVLICFNTLALNSAVIPMGLMESIYTKPIVAVTDETVLKLLDNNLDNLNLLQSANLGFRQEELVIMTLRSIVRLMAILRGGSPSLDRVSYGQGDVYFRNFIELIETNVKQNHEVSFYADQLHISPKYLNEVCKLKSGHKAKEIISSFLISKIKQEITMSGKSIKTIAYEYGFSDQSSMGKFFNKMTGQSPGDFRKSVNSPYDNI